MAKTLIFSKEPDPKLPDPDPDPSEPEPPAPIPLPDPDPSPDVIDPLDPVSLPMRAFSLRRAA